MTKKEQKDFIRLFHKLQKEIHFNATLKGWWDKSRNDLELIALHHSELGEATEAVRNGNPPDDKIPQFSGCEAELADVIIRICDHAGARDWRLAEALAAKIEFNKTRTVRHGGKLH